MLVVHAVHGRGLGGRPVAVQNRDARRVDPEAVGRQGDDGCPERECRRDNQKL
ncbi:MAG: hypothetical protein O3A37_08780 [Planctomycetota bacterium]|nr:hypothetical protein [Planctomycetota bacterium]